MRRTKGLVGALVVLLVLAGTASVALAGAARSTVEITRATGDPPRGGVELRGEVSSSKARCMDQRTVKVYHDVPPPGPSDDDFFLGSTQTSHSGVWRFETKELPDKVYAKIKRIKGKCKGDRSPTVKVDFT